MIAAALYRAATWPLAPLASLLLARRAARGKEEISRLGERWGRATLARPPGRLVWLHAASVGESLSLLPIMEKLLARLPQAELLVTTGTVTSARLLGQRLPPARARHQFLPIDHPLAIRRFLDHWRPDLALWVESEFWPNLLLDTHRRGIPMALLNGRISERSFRGWQRAPGLIAALIGSFDLVLAQDEIQAGRLRALGKAEIVEAGDLKAAGGALAAPAEELARLSALIGTRPVWLAASTHDGEEHMAVETHGRIEARFPGLLTLIAPRHPARADAIAGAFPAFRVARRSNGMLPDPSIDIYLIDTLGELGLFYRLAPVVLVAGSMGAPGTIGGHNPLEAAQLGCAVLFGPDTENCRAVCQALERAGAALRLADETALIFALRDLLGDPARVAAMGAAGREVAAAGRGVIERAMQLLEPLVAKLAEGDARP